MWDNVLRYCKDFLPLGTSNLLQQKSKEDKQWWDTCSRWNAQLNNKEEIGTDESESDNNVFDDEESSNEGIDKIEQEWNSTVAGIKYCIMESPHLKADDWIAVAFLGAWYYGQFIEFDDETLEVYVNILDDHNLLWKHIRWPSILFDQCWLKK